MTAPGGQPPRVGGADPFGGLDEGAARFDVLARVAPVAVFQLDGRGRAVFLNEYWTEITGQPVADGLGLGWTRVLHPDEAAVLVHVGTDALAQGTVFEHRWRIRRLDGEERWVAARALPLLDESGAVKALIGTVSDHTDEVAAREESARLTAVLDATTDYVLVLDPEGRVLYANPSARATLGVEEDTRLVLDDVYDDVSRERYHYEVLPELLSTGAWQGEMTLALGEYDQQFAIPVSQLFVSHFGPSGQLERISTIAREVTERKELERQLEHHAFHDQLTGLPNRRALHDALGGLLERPMGDRHLALLFVDLDGFKAVNDRLGHDAGDELLRGVAGRISGVLRGSDLVARLGGDEFVAVCPHLSRREDVVLIADRLVETLAVPFDLSEGAARVAASIGIAFAEPPGSAEAEGVGPEMLKASQALLSRADAAMYAAKQAGKACWRVWQGGEILTPDDVRISGLPAPEAAEASEDLAPASGPAEAPSDRPEPASVPAEPALDAAEQPDGGAVPADPLRAGAAGGLSSNGNGDVHAVADVLAQLAERAPTPESAAGVTAGLGDVAS